jgi:hypothetical protein
MAQASSLEKGFVIGNGAGGGDDDDGSSSGPSGGDPALMLPASRKFDANFVKRFLVILGIVFPSFTSLPFVLFVLLLFMCFLGE